MGRDGCAAGDQSSYGAAVVEPATLGMLTAFAAGAVSFLSPCVLPLVPAYVSYVTGQSLAPGSGAASLASRASSAFLSVCFVLGFSAVFVALGASATALSRVLLQYRYEAGIIGGAVVTLFGLAMLIGIERIPFLRRDAHFHLHAASAGPAPAFVLGAAFAFGWTPCIGPILGVILTAAAVSESAAAGIRLLAAYSAGLGIPFLLTAAFLHEAAGRLRSMRKAGRPLMVAAGLVMVAIGVAMMTGRLTAFSYWLLERFPALGRIG
ncbi:MAG: cytochrome c biogenesis protein CcdA [Betaproteobacteria bacterium]|nr:MAG: cytochrome c biogenesis protein CcdA [Betaproteobacteria bacterium]